jgi:hypothetical protein
MQVPVRQNGDRGVEATVERFLATLNVDGDCCHGALLGGTPEAEKLAVV